MRKLIKDMDASRLEDVCGAWRHAEVRTAGVWTELREVERFIDYARDTAGTDRQADALLADVDRLKAVVNEFYAQLVKNSQVWHDRLRSARQVRGEQ